MESNYSAPVNKLLTYGECSYSGEWPNYLELGFSGEHIPDLIRMATDDELNWADSDSLEVWAPVHAWRALGQLRAEESIGPLTSLFHELEENDWVGEELPVVFGMIGPKAVPALAEYLSGLSHGLHPRITAIHSLERIGNMHLLAKDQCISVLTQQLERFGENDPTLNGFLISHLADLHAVESLPSMRKAYEQECVDYTIIGDLEDVEIHMGLRESRSTPPDYPDVVDVYFPGLRSAATSNVRKKAKIGRNEPCPCGSGKKYKRCCLDKVAR